MRCNDLTCGLLVGRGLDRRDSSAPGLVAGELVVVDLGRTVFFEWVECVSV